MRATQLIAVLAACAAFAAGCGGDDDEDSGNGGGGNGGDVAQDGGGGAGDPRAAFEAYLTAFKDGDAEETCSFLTDEAVDKIKAAGAESCEKAIDQASKLLSDEQTDLVTEIEITDVETNGDKATLTLKYPEQLKLPETKQGMTRVDGSWKLDSPATAGG